MSTEPGSLAQREAHASNSEKEAEIQESWDIFRRVLVVAAVVAGGFLLWRLSTIFLLFFGSILIAVLLRAAALPIARRTYFSESWSIVIAGLGILAILGVILFFFGALIATQLRNLVEQLPQALASLQDRLGLENLSQQIASRLKDYSGTILANAATVTFWIFTALADIVLVAIGGAFLAMNPTLYRDGVVSLFPKEQRDRVRETLNYSGTALKYWLLGQLVSMLLVGILVGVGLWLIGVQYPVGLALIAGLAEFIPIVGPIIGAIPAILIASTQGWSVLLWVIALFVVIQQLESNMITPIVQREAVSLPPVLTLFAVLGFGTLFGPLGLLFATPLAVVLLVAVKKLYVRDILGDQTRIPGQK